MNTTLEARIANLREIVAKLERAGALTEEIDPLYEMLAAYEELT